MLVIFEVNRLKVEFFAASNGQGKIYLGTDTYTTTGPKSFTANFPDGFNQDDLEFLVGTATDTDGNTSEFSLEVSLSSPDFVMANFSIYPNPATEWFKVKLNSKANFNLELFSITGQLIKTYKNVNGDMQIFTKNLPQGVYLLDIYNQSNNQSERKKNSNQIKA